MIDTNNFQISKYLNIIKVLGDSTRPISISELKKKTNLKESTLFRGLNWLQNIQTKDGLKTDKLDAYYLKQDVYIQSSGQKKSKHNSYKLNKRGLDFYNSLFVKEADISFVDEILHEYNIYEKLWEFIYQNEEGFLYRKDFEDVILEPWTQQLFEFFEKKNEDWMNEILQYIPGPRNLRLYRFFEILTSIILTHPLWKKQINIPSLTKKQYQYLNDISLLSEEFHIYGTFPDIFCIHKLDNLIQTIQQLVEKHLKIYYWKEISLTTPTFILKQKILEHVLDDLYIECHRYREFISEYILDFKSLIKLKIAENIQDASPNLRYPLNLMERRYKEQFDLILNKKLFQSDIEELPSKLFGIGATHEIIIKQAKRLMLHIEKEPENMRIKLKLFEMLVHNYTHELRNDFEFYKSLNINLKDLIEKLFNEFLLYDSISRRKILTLGFIFYKSKYRDFDKAFEISKELYEYYQSDENFLENLLLLHYTQKEWELDLIENLTFNSLALFPENINFLFSDLLVKVIQDKNFINTNKFKNAINRIIQLEEKLLNFIDIIRFFVDHLDKHNMGVLSLGLLEHLTIGFQNPDLYLMYAEEIMKQGYVTQAIEEFILLIDVFPNKFIESYVFSQLLNPGNLNRIDKSNEVIVFLYKILEILKPLSESMKWHIGKSNIKDYRKKKDSFNLKLKEKLKDLEPLLNNNYTLNLPLKIKAIILKSLGRKKNFESSLRKILEISPRSIWVNTELALLYFDLELFNDAIETLQKVDHLKEVEHYSVPYFKLTWFSNILEVNNYNLFLIYKKAKRYHEAILLMEDFIKNPPPNRSLILNDTELAELLINCYWEEYGNIEVIYEKILNLSRKIDNPIKDELQFYSGTKSKSYFLKQGLIDFIFKKRNYSKCLDWLIQLNKSDPTFLNPEQSFFSPFNKNIYYLAECNLNLNNLILAKKYFLQCQEDIKEDIRFDSAAIVSLIRPFPEYLRVNEKSFYEMQIIKGLNKIQSQLSKLDDLTKLIFKTNIERSLGNISLLLKERGMQGNKLFEMILKHTLTQPTGTITYYKIIVSVACAINGYIDEMDKYLSEKDLIEDYPCITRILQLLYAYYTVGYEEFNEINISLSKLIPDSILPDLFNLHYLRFKIGKSKSQDIFSIFERIWNTTGKSLNLSGDEKKILEFLKTNFRWYPFIWAIQYEEFVKKQSKEDISLLKKVIIYIKNKIPNGDEELFTFITRFINKDRNIKDMLSYLMIVKSYDFPETKYYLLNQLNLGVDEYGIEGYGELAYSANRLQDVIKQIDEYRKDQVKKWRSGTRNFHWSDERYLKLLLQAYKNKEFDEKEIPNFYKDIKKRGVKISDEKKKYFEALTNLRKGYYEGAAISSYQILLIFIENPELEWKDEYFKIWIVSKLLDSFNRDIELDSQSFLEEINTLFDFDKLKKKPLHFQLLIVDVLDHALLEEYRDDITDFGTQMIVNIIDLVDIADNKALELISEKLTRKREIIGKFDLKIVEYIDKISVNLILSSRSATLYKNYLNYIKALILFENQKVGEARIIIEDLFRSIDENEFYSIYYDINDLLLELK